MAEGGSKKRDIPVRLGNFSVLDTEFSNMRERFDAEMKKMEEEMKRFRWELMNREANFFRTTSSISSFGNFDNKQESLENLNSSLIQEEGGIKKLKLRFDVSQYLPEEIIVKTVDNKLLVQAKHEEKTENKSIYREYNREFLLPQGTSPEAIRSCLSKDGVLTVEAPLPAIEGPHN